MNVIKAAHPIPNHKATNKIAFVNHGGITVASKPGIAIAKLETRLKPTTFEYLCCKVSAGCMSFIVVAVYRPGSQHITDAFFHKFTTLLESLAAFNCKTVVAGDLNVHLECLYDSEYTKTYRSHSRIQHATICRDFDA